MDIKKVVSEMTVEEKAGMCSGKDFWRSKSVERLGVPSIMVSDGPHGLRKQDTSGDHLGVNDSIKAVCFPTGCTVASSFDKELIYEMGETLGNECQAEDVAIILGPAVNIKRSPLCGRNFEYFSEDPFLSGIMSTAQIKGIQSQGIGTSIKHFLANNQEHRRMTSDSQIDERTLREIYLASFEMPVKEAKPWTVMCSYNKVNGVYASENHRFLTEVLHDEWNFNGFVVSDWGAVNNRVDGVKAGLDLEMPSSGVLNDNKIIQAVKEGRLDEKTLDQTVERILGIVEKYTQDRKPEAVFNKDKDHKTSRRIASESMILLKNEGVLPLNETGKIAFIGEFAEKPRFQGGGSSHINCHKISDALSYVKNLKQADIQYAKGYELVEDCINEELTAQAVELARGADVAVVFAGLPDIYESEGYDRKHMRLPDSHNHLIEEVSKVQPNTVVVLHNGSPVEMPWEPRVKGILEAYLSGQAVGEAVIDILFGDVNPSGKLAETFPVKLEDNPSYLYYVGEKDVVEYREGIFIGYRYYDAKKMNVLYPFGHGLSYTSFVYEDLELDKMEMKETDLLRVKVKVTNTGSVFGKEVVQLYVTPSKTGQAIRPVKELKGFEKVSLEPGETKTLIFELDQRSFAYFNTQVNDWLVESGSYGIEIGASSRDIRCIDNVLIDSSHVVLAAYHLNSTLGDIMSDVKAMSLLGPYIAQIGKLFGVSENPDDESGGAVSDEMKQAMMADLPLRAMLNFGGGAISESEVEALLAQLNE